MKRITIALALLAGLVLSACSPATGGGRTQLAAEEVRSTFIGRKWQNDVGLFHFGRDGTYTYKRKNESKTRGPWPYRIRGDGVVVHPGWTHYTFYRNGDGSYTYYHSRNGKYYPAEPGG